MIMYKKEVLEKCHRGS